MWQMEVPRLGVEVELQLLAYTTVTVTPDPSLVCNLYHSSQQRWILNPLREARDWTQNPMVPRWIHFHCTTTGTPNFHILSEKVYYHFLLALLLVPSEFKHFLYSNYIFIYTYFGGSVNYLFMAFVYFYFGVFVFFFC